MPVIRIQQFDDPRLAVYRSVSDAELLRRRNRFVAEGRLVVERVLDGGHRVESMLLNDASFRALEPLISRLQAEVPVYICDTREFAAITGFNLHRGCLALAERPQPLAVRDVTQGAELILVLEDVTDADNVGSAFRNAAAFGAGVILSEGCCDPFYRKAIRTSVGAVLRTPYARMNNWPDDLAELKADGFTIIALTPRTEAVELAAHARRQARRKLAVMVGSEGPGLSPQAESMTDVSVRIPISRHVDSLNVATATGIALYYFTNP
jgi:tRNA G18 (ribose-2'-O)-methylase SpoU